MNIDKVNLSNIQNVYKSKKIEQNPIKEKRADSVEISDLGKHLNQINSDKENINMDKINELKQRIENGTYQVNSRELAKKIIENIRREK
ncbi:flagellar biosynthesis anti-sigma factor FlgM [Romboutsia sp.]|uniref:flagellar biosynthesis anti-sigma factor FlgM n=1 Tax=Romboutsia sp. TaxID=1965302 RepID=UPI003F2C46DE